LNASINVVRGNIVQGDIIKVDFEKKGISILGTVFAWGFFSDVVDKAQDWRGCLGSKRYLLCGAKELFCTGGCYLRSHNTKVKYNGENDPLSNMNNENNRMNSNSSDLVTLS